MKGEVDPSDTMTSSPLTCKYKKHFVPMPVVCDSQLPTERQLPARRVSPAMSIFPTAEELEAKRRIWTAMQSRIEGAAAERMLVAIIDGRQR
ncbi:hypothetical protein M5K25_011824 [Dendrobium thyrsiflorum]|uniref:Uncharacterized protein n=1 Tax=Dendrobium thyrsiflorum TaxID=117978 RepID=A0ABD0V3V2_DENTH